MSEPVLSILIVSHNQVKELQRCIESVLMQDLPFEYEIIISDDNSTDGTWELIMNYQTKYPDVINGYQVNSDDCSPTCTSERSGHNRSNAYRHSKGKYFVHIDGDDYLIGTDSYRKQVELLDSHPECSMCMQNILCVKEGEGLTQGKSVHKLHFFKTGDVVTAKEFFLNKYFIFHSAFVFRRNTTANPADLYHKFYVDDIITFHHLQFGNIVCLDECCYVYVKYPKSITSSLAVSERHIIWTLDLTVFCSMMIPYFSGLYYAGNLKDLLSAVNVIRNGKVFSDKTKLIFAQFDAFIYKTCLKDKRPIYDIIRLQIIRCVLIVLLKRKQYSAFLYSLLNDMLICRSNTIPFNFKY
ncbi:MAG: glycosyltransferase [Paludibacteraceae bacterium]|nr:glycosyltransferase [Paludibacteraceae bacterium]